MDYKNMTYHKSVKTLVGALILVKIFVHFLTATQYGYFIDELYTIALSKHLAWGYVDLPPIVPALLAMMRLFFGESLLAVRVLPAIAGGITMLFVCLITMELEGKRFAVCLSGVAFLIAPVWLTMNSFFAYDGFDQLALSAFFYILIRFTKTENKKLWLVLGAVAGVAFMTKATILYYAPGIAVALLVSKQQKDFTSPFPWLGIGLFVLIISPFLLWQVANGYPTLEYWFRYGAGKTFQATPLEYLVNLVILFHPAVFPIWGLGIYSFIKQSHLCIVIIMFFISLVLLFALKAKAYMIAGFILPLLAGGAVWLEQWIMRKEIKWLKTASLAVMAALGIVLAPASIPILSPPMLTNYFGVFGVLNQGIKLDNSKKVTFPQTLADRFGWDNMVKTVAEVYYELTEEEQQKCSIYAGYYGAAGAIDLLGRQYGLPHAISGHLTYYLWGYGDYNGDVLIVLGGDQKELEACFETVTQKAVVVSEYTMSYNTNLPVYVCRNILYPVEEFWPTVISYD